MTENTTASGAADITPEIECDCLVAWNRSEFGASQHDTVHPMYLTAFKSGYKAALAAFAPVAPTQPAPFNPRTRWLTVVYRGVEAGDEAKVICEHPKVSAMSWSHALDDRDDAIAAAPKAAPSPASTEQARWPANAAEVREFIGSNYSVLTYSNPTDGDTPSDNDHYELTAHDLLSAISQWTMDDEATPTAAPQQGEYPTEAQLVAALKAASFHDTPYSRKDMTAALIAARGAAQAAPAMDAVMRTFIQGMSVSVDVSTGDHDAWNRYFGEVTEVMECDGGKHGVTLLVQDAEPNFKAQPAPVVEDASPHRTDAEIVAQTEELARYLLSWGFNHEYVLGAPATRNSEHPFALRAWNAACHIQDLLTQTDVWNAVAELDDAQAAQPEGGQAMKNLARSNLAAEAEVGIYVMGAVIAMLEGGVTPGGPDGTSVTAKKIIVLAKREQQRQLKRMDKHRALIREASNAG